MQVAVIPFIPPEVPINEDTMREYTEEKTKKYEIKEFTKDKLIISISSLLKRYMRNEPTHSPESLIAKRFGQKMLPALDPNHYKWNIFNELEIPEGSFFLPQEMVEKDIDFSKYVHYSSLVAPVLQDVFSSIMVSPDKHVTLPFANDSVTFYSIGYPFQATWVYLKEKVKGYEREVSDSQNPKSYKIHITPNHEYALYTLFHLFTIMHNNPVFHIGKINGKIMLNPRGCKPNPTDTTLIRANGGSAPTIVIYGNDNREEMIPILNALLKEFKSEISILGGMTPDYPYRALPFNVRLNSLIQYAQGDRGRKLDARDRFIEKIKTSNDRKKAYGFAQWAVKEFGPQKCADPTQTEKLSRLSLQLFGKNICLPQYQTYLSKKECLDDICWMRPLTSKEPMISPFEISEFKEEAVVIGGGRYTRRRSRTKKTRRVKKGSRKY